MTQFFAISLGHWLAAARGASVPHIDAERIHDFNVGDVLRWDQGRKDVERRLGYGFAKAKAARQPGHMFRWDCCAPDDVKSRLARGDYHWHKDLLERLTLDDPRLFHILWHDWHLPKVTLWKRPWIKAAIWKGYPVEYRVFVRDSQVIGISSYYPQRPLLGWPAVNRDVEVCHYYAMQLMLRMPPMRPWPRHLGLSESARHFTVDFIKAADGTIMLLEGGPPYTPHWGAHPCCFEGREIEGVQLARPRG